LGIYYNRPRQPGGELLEHIQLTYSHAMRGKNYSLRKKHLAFCYPIGLFGFYYQLHQIFIAQQNEGIALRTAKGFFIAALLGFCIYILPRLFPYPSIRTHFYKLLHIIAYIFYLPA